MSNRYRSILSLGSSTPPFSNVNSFSFDGVDDYFIGTSTYSELDGQTKATISFWIKPISGAPLYEFIASNGNQFSIIIYENNSIQMSLSYTVGQYINANISHITYGQWNHVCFCVDLDLPIGQEGKVFINGVDRTQTSATGTMPQFQNANGSLRLGESEDFSYNPLNGNLDEFAIWSGTDQRANVSEIYGGGQAVDLNNLATAPQPTTWQRMGDNATWNGRTWTMTDVNGGYTNRSINMVEANRTTDVPPNPFVNLQSILLDGVDDYVSVPNSTSLNITSALSVSMWFKTTSSSVMYPLTQGSGSQIKYYVQFYAPINRIRVLIFDGSGVNIAIDNTQVFNDGQWHNLTFTTDALTTTDGVKVYFDSNLLTNKGTLNNNGIRTASSGLFIGQIPNTARFNGNIDEVSLFNAALSQSDVTSIYGGGVPSSLSSYSSLVSWWRFEGSGTTATDSGSGGNDGTLINGVTRSTDVPTIPSFTNTKSIELDGVDEYVDVGVLSSIESQAWSISLWVKWNALDGTNEAIISTRQNGLGSATGIDLNITDGGGKLRARTYKATSGGIGAELIVTLSSVGITTGVWYHIAVTYASSTLNMKINDGAIYSGTDSGTYVASGASAYLGNWRKSNALHNGYIDEVGIFDAELSASDITAIYNSGVPTSLSSYSSLTNWWRCGDGDTSPTLTDNGSGGNNGTMTNFSTFSSDVPT